MTALTACRDDNPFLAEYDTPYGIPPFEKIENSHYVPAFEAGVKQQNEEIAAIINNPLEPTFDNVIEPLERSGVILSRVVGVLFNLSESLNSPELQAVVEELLPRFSEHSDDIYMNPDLFAKVKAVYDAPQDSLTLEQQMVLKKNYEAFVNNGIGLSARNQERLREINSRLSVLSQKFGDNLLAENNAYAEKCGRSVSSYYGDMESVQDRNSRKEMFEAYASRCARGNDRDNNALLLEILKLKQEKARMLGYDTPAAWILHDKMAETPQNVDKFLAGIMEAAVAKADEEVALAKELLDKDIAEGNVENDVFRPWDYAYYLNKVKERDYSLNEDEIRPYFQMENVRAGVFSAAGRLYGLNFKKIENAPKYHPEVEAFEVSNTDGSLVGVLLTDYFPRDSKRGGAWMNNVRNQEIVLGQNIRPIIVNVGNFTKAEGGKPALISIDNVETMFHEFGHALHGLLSNCTYPSVSGTDVARDFVELPSQINENFAFQPELLREYARHYETGEVIPAELVAKILATRTFGMGFRTTELCAASILDMYWHELTEIPDEAFDNPTEWVAAREKEFCNRMGLPDYIIPRYRTSYFNHIFNSGYSAGYYSYLWAEVLDKDAFQVFVREGVMNPETGRRFRECVLSKGGSDEPMTLYRNFTGGDPNPEYLLIARGLK